MDQRLASSSTQVNIVPRAFLRPPLSLCSCLSSSCPSHLTLAGVRFYPKEITSSRGGASYNTGEEIGEIDQMYIFDEGNFDRQPLSLNRASFGDCSDPETVREAYRNFDYFCVFVKLNRVHSFKPKQDVKLSAKLDFPSVGEVCSTRALRLFASLSLFPCLSLYVSHSPSV